MLFWPAPTTLPASEGVMLIVRKGRGAVRNLAEMLVSSRMVKEILFSLTSIFSLVLKNHFSKRFWFRGFAVIWTWYPNGKRVFICSSETSFSHSSVPKNFGRISTSSSYDFSLKTPVIMLSSTSANVVFKVDARVWLSSLNHPRNSKPSLGSA